MWMVQMAAWIKRTTKNNNLERRGKGGVPNRVSSWHYSTKPARSDLVQEEGGGKKGVCPRFGLSLPKREHTGKRRECVSIVKKRVCYRKLLFELIN